MGRHTMLPRMDLVAVRAMLPASGQDGVGDAHTCALPAGRSSGRGARRRGAAGARRCRLVRRPAGRDGGGARDRTDPARESGAGHRPWVACSLYRHRHAVAGAALGCVAGSVAATTTTLGAALASGGAWLPPPPRLQRPSAAVSARLAARRSGSVSTVSTRRPDSLTEGEGTNRSAPGWESLAGAARSVFTRRSCPRPRRSGRTD